MKIYANAKAYLDDLASRGRYSFSTEEFSEAAASSKASAYNALARLADQDLIASPAKGFYVIIPPEYRSLGCLPAEQFIPSLFAKTGSVYYAGLLTAAQYYGCAHQRPQGFQVVVERSRRNIQCGGVTVSFIANKRAAATPTREFNTLRGTVRVSTPEATAIDLVGYADRVGGLDMVASVLVELADEIDPLELRKQAEKMPVVWIQRLGYLLDHVDQHESSMPLIDLVGNLARDYALLAPSRPKVQLPRNARWRILVNDDVECEH